MESWRPEPENERRPDPLAASNYVVALGLHVAVFLVFFAYSWVHGLFDKEEKVIPIDLTVIVNENLDGKEDEPPPLDDPPPPPPKVKPKPKPVVKKPDPPKALEQIVTNITAKVDKKEEKKKEEPKKEDPKKPEEPKKTAKELREERIREMRNRAKNTNKKPVEIKVKNQPSGDGRTAKKTLSNAEIMKLLNAGYKPGKVEQLAASDEQLGFSLIKSAMESKWDTPPWTSDLKPMTIRMWFGPGGRVVKFKLEASSGDAAADGSIRSAASRVGSIPGLPAAFIEKYRSAGVPVRFTVKPQ